MTGPTTHDHLRRLMAACVRFGDCVETAEQWGAVLAGELATGHRLLAAGNGGSAAQAQHLTAELVGRFATERQPLSAICLSAETSSLTALLNDYGPQEVFARQVAAHGREGDVLVLMSTSGRSPNLLTAADRAVEAGLVVWAFTGPAPNPLAARAHAALCVPASTTATVQELHLVALHIMCAAVDTHLASGAEVERRPVAATPAPRVAAPSISAVGAVMGDTHGWGGAL